MLKTKTSSDFKIAMQFSESQEQQKSVKTVSINYILHLFSYENCQLSRYEHAAQIHVEIFIRSNCLKFQEINQCKNDKYEKNDECNDSNNDSSDDSSNNNIINDEDYQKSEENNADDVTQLMKQQKLSVSSICRQSDCL